ncbi:MAG: hypothetical protein IJP07_07600 [Firmicutes bacterium]|nr:hypothetical protein [Bacillota bacterium]
MKRYLTLFLLIPTLLLLTACGTSPYGEIRITEVEEELAGKGFQVETELKRFTAADFSENIQKGLDEASFNPLGASIGSTVEDFATMEECVEFLGYSVYNPLEDCSWLEQATHIGMPLEKKDEHISLRWAATPQRELRNLNIDSGYRLDSARLQMSIVFHCEEEESFSRRYFRQAGSQATYHMEEYPMDNGNTAMLVTADDDDARYFSIEAFFVQDELFYSLNFVGEKENPEAVRAMLEKVLAAF